MNSSLHGIIPAVVTPIDDQERFAPAAFEVLIERLCAAGVDGVYVCGQTGEGLLQTIEMREQVAKAAIRFVRPGKQVIIHVGAYRTQDAVRLARHAAVSGATAISSLPPAGAYEWSEIHTYYRRLAEATDLPVLVYFHPEVSPALSTVSQILDLCSLPNVVGVKFTDFDTFKLSQIKNARKIAFNGRDEILIAGLLSGADGGIGSFYNLVPHLFVEMFALVQEQRWNEAKQIQQRINELISVVLRFPVIPATKALLRISGIDCGPCVSPRRTLTPEEETRLRTELDRAGVSWLLEVKERTA